MTSSPKFLFLLFLLTTLLSLNVQARESKFFSKVSTSTAPSVTVNDNNNRNVKETTVPSKEEDEQPSFFPENQSYGLYGQESKEVPANTTTTTTTTKPGNEADRVSTYAPYTTGINRETYATGNTNPKYYNKYNNNAFEEDDQPENLGETSLHHTGYTTTNSIQNTNNNNYYSDAYGHREKQGMSDTRFLENGKYYYDVNNVNSYYTNPNQNQNSGYNYDTRTYYNNNDVEGYRRQEVPNERYVP